MSEKPIMFNAFSIAAIRDRRKDVTRRVIKEQPPKDATPQGILMDGRYVFWRPGDNCDYAKPRYRKGDMLWVKETFYRGCGPTWGSNCFVYAADKKIAWNPGTLFDNPDLSQFRKKPAIFMPRRLARLWLEVVDVRPERLQEITLEEIRREGIRFDRIEDNSTQGEDSFEISQREKFQQLWDSTNSHKPGCKFDDNPWVWRNQFKVLNGKGK